MGSYLIVFHEWQLQRSQYRWLDLTRAAKTTMNAVFFRRRGSHLKKIARNFCYSAGCSSLRMFVLFFVFDKVLSAADWYWVVSGYGNDLLICAIARTFLMVLNIARSIQDPLIFSNARLKTNLSSIIQNCLALRRILSNKCPIIAKKKLAAIKFQ